MVLDQSPTERKAYSDATHLVRLKGNKQSRSHIGCNPWPTIFNLDLYSTIEMTYSDPNSSLAGRPLGCGIDGIPEQVGQHLLDLDAIGMDLGHGSRVDEHCNATCSRVIRQRSHNSRCHLSEIERKQTRAAFGHKVSHPVDYFARAKHLNF